MVGPVTPPFRRAFDVATSPYAARNALGIIETTGGAPAPADAEYITGSADATLTNERVLTNTPTVTWDFATPGQAKANVTVDLSAYAPLASPTFTGDPKAPTPATGDNDTSIATTAFVKAQGYLVSADLSGYAPLASPTFTGDPKAPTPATADNDTSIATTAFVKAQGYVTGGPYQPLDGDLTSIAGYGSTGAWLYRSGADTWSPVTIGSGLTFTSGTLAASGGSAVASVPQEGRLTYVSATALKFAPYNGNKIKINGALYTIPNAGIAGLGNTGVYVNGVAGQNLAANTFYTVYAIDVGGVVTGNFRTDAAGSHRPSQTTGNEGVEVLYVTSTEFASNTVIGMCRTNASSQFVDSATQRFVRTWFNPLAVAMASTPLAAETTTSTSWVEITSSKRVEFLSWANELVKIAFTGTQRHQTAGAYVASCIGVDSATPVSPESGGHSSAANYRLPISSHFSSMALSEGYHDARMLGAVGSGTGEWPTPAVASGIGARLTVSIG